METSTTTSAVTSSGASVPVIDLTTATPQDVADALVECSCMYVTGHGVPEDLIGEMIDVSVDFFQEPRELKERVAWDGSGVWHGWQPDGAAAIRGENDAPPPNLVEWYMAHDLETFETWPEGRPDFVEVWTRYYATMDALSSRIIRMIAEALDLPADEIDAYTERQFANLCVNHYPPQLEAPMPGQIRLSPHTDESAITILRATDAPGGLQVRVPGTGAWTPIDFAPGTYLVQAGDLIERWTNGRIRANIHRVVNPPREVAEAGMRDTIVYFHFPALDTVVSPSPSQVAASGGAVRYAPITTIEHILKRQDKYVPPVADD